MKINIKYGQALHFFIKNDVKKDESTMIISGWLIRNNKLLNRSKLYKIIYGMQIWNFIPLGTIENVNFWWI